MQLIKVMLSSVNDIMTWLPSPWPCLGTTGSHGGSDVMGGGVRQGELEQMTFLSLFRGGNVKSVSAQAADRNGPVCRQTGIKAHR